MRRYYLCPIIGKGTDEDPFCPAVAEHGSSWGMVDLRPDSTKPLGLAVAYLDSDIAVADRKLVLLTDDLSDKAISIRKAIESRFNVSLTAETLPDILAEILIASQRLGLCKPIRPMSDGQYRIYLGGLIWGPPEPKYRKGTITDNFNRADADALGTSPEGWSWTELYGDINIETNTALSPDYSQGGSLDRADSDLSSDNHYAQITITGLSGTSAGGGSVVRKDATAIETFYHGRVNIDNLQQLFKWVDAGATQLISASYTYSPPHDVKTTPNGTTIKVDIDGTELSTTDSDISGNYRTGIRYYQRARGDDFEAGELAVAVYAPYYYEMLMAGAN